MPNLNMTTEGGEICDVNYSDILDLVEYQCCNAQKRKNGI